MKLTLLPDPDFYAPRTQKPLTLTGGMHVEQGTLRVLQSIPADILPSLLVGLSSKHLKYAYVSGSVLRYQQGDIVGFSLDSTLDEEGFELPDNPLQPQKREPEVSSHDQCLEAVKQLRAGWKERDAKKRERRERPLTDFQS